jgi:hypothetical protein
MDSESRQCRGGRPCPPPFPVFPFVFPLMFPIGLAAILIAMGRRRRGGLAARVASLEEKVEHLTAEGRR